MDSRKIMASITALVIAAGMLSSCAGQASDDKETLTITTQTASAEETDANENNDNTANNGEVKLVSDVTEGLKTDGKDWYNEDEKYSELVEKLQKQFMEASQPKGVIMLATDKDIIMIRSFNSTETDGTTPANAYTTYEMGSVTKMMTATAILKLAEEGKLSIDDTLDKYFPDYKHADEITLYHLLHMQSGIYDNLNEAQQIAVLKGWDKEIAMEFSDKLKKDAFTDEEIIGLTSDLDLKFEPGSQMAYSNTGYYLMALIIEQVTGKTYAEYLQENIFDVCSMEHSSSCAKGDITSIPYDKDASDVSQMVDEDGYWCETMFSRGAGGVHSCAADMVMFDRSLMGGKLLNEDSLNEMFNTDKGYGCGWSTLNGGASDKHYTHNGRQGSYMTNNTVFDTEEYGRVYFIQLYSQSMLSLSNKIKSNNGIVKAALGC